MDSKGKKKYIKHEPVSLVRKKAQKMEKSRDTWKEKNQDKLDSIKALKARMDETKSSRENWKLSSLQHANETEVLKQQVQALEQELIQERLEKIGLLKTIDDLKKTRH